MYILLLFTHNFFIFDLLFIESYQTDNNFYLKIVTLILIQISEN